jgi:hypothetical protein
MRATAKSGSDGPFSAVAQLEYFDQTHGMLQVEKAMSKDMLGPVIRAAVGVPQGRLDLLAKITSNFASDNPDGEAWYKHMHGAWSAGIPIATPPKRLIRIGERSIEITRKRDPAEFYRNRAGLWVSNDFQRLVVAKATPVDAGAIFKITCDTLAEDFFDLSLEEDLPTDHLFDESGVSAIVAEMISRQQDVVQEGDLIGNGRCNLFYLSSGFVYVYWDGDRRRWRVNSRERDGVRWGRGGHVFSPAD